MNSSARLFTRIKGELLATTPFNQGAKGNGPSIPVLTQMILRILSDMGARFKEVKEVELFWVKENSRFETFHYKRKPRASAPKS